MCGSFLKSNMMYYLLFCEGVGILEGPKLFFFCTPWSVLRVSLQMGGELFSRRYSTVVRITF